MKTITVTPKWVKTVKKNIKLPPLKVYHSRLLRSDVSSIYRSECPLCPEGVLLMRRDEDQGLSIKDNCIGCGRRFIYVDVKPGTLKLEYTDGPLKYS